MGLPIPEGRQSDVVYMHPRGHLVVLGTAGTGKTVMAIHRAIHLANPSTVNSGPTALFTYNGSLASYLEHLAGGHRSSVKIETYGAFTRGYLHSRGHMKKDVILDDRPRRGHVQRVVADMKRSGASSRFLEQEAEFFADELAWIDGHGLQTLEAYLAAERVGRMAPLQPSQRKVVWQIRKGYQERMQRIGKWYDWPSLPSAVRTALAQDGTPRRYRHIVVDEAQDLSPEAIRSLAEAIPPDGSLTLFADYAQQLYGQRISWRSCGLRVGKAEIFVDNYRNSPEIAKLALAMASMPHFRDSADLVEPKAPQRAAGTRPTIMRCQTAAEEAAAIKEAAKASSTIARIGVLARTRAEALRAVDGLPNVNVLHDKIRKWDVANGVWAGTYFSAKGLEFDIVLLPHCGANRMPDADMVTSFGTDEALSRESRLLYVAVTRARDEILITHTGDLTPLLPPVTSGLYQVVR